MSLIFKIAVRNIQRHKGKSLIIGVILFVGALLMTVGNGVISGMEKGLAKHIVDGFTGDVVIISDKQESDNVLIEFMGRSIEPITNYKAIKSVLEKQGFVDKFLPAGKNAVMILNDEGGAPGFGYLVGVDFGEYQKMFPNNIKPVEGELLTGNQRGVLLPTGARKEFYDYTSIWFVPEGKSLDTANLTPEAKKANRNTLVVKDSIVFMGMATDNSSSDIRMGVKGVVKYGALNTIWGHFTLIDIESYRRCLGYFAASDQTVELSQTQQEFLSTESIDDLFSEDALVDQKQVGAPEISFANDGAEPTPAKPEVVDLEAGTYNLIFTFLKDGTNPEEGVKRLNALFKEHNLGVRAITWRKAAGMVGSMTTVISVALIAFVAFLFFVAIIIIVNTLSMAALERTTEIGMMRAVGARRSFISRMFIGETAALSFIFGGAGILTGIVIVNILPLFKITSDNDMVQLLFGGDTFHPTLSGPAVLVTILLLALVTVIAVIYPMIVARNIKPLDAISRD